MFNATMRDALLDALMAHGPVIPVLGFQNPREAVDTCLALREGGLRVFEITLRSPAALACLEAVAALGEDFLVGAGTIRNPQQLTAAARTGARFAVSPGFTEELAETAQDLELPMIPGVMTPSEILRAQAAGYSRLKFFPAEAAGGVAMLRALSGPFAELRFLPTGGVTAENAPEYLALNQVPCVGGSWLTARELVAARDWGAITTLARRAQALRARMQEALNGS